jgi:tetratricopeptide (TPR) repeat protein
MPHRITFTIALAAAASTGCMSGRYYEEGYAAEKKGDYARAYDRYCLAAAANPEGVGIGSAINRVSNKAAAYWETQAHIAVNDGRLADAWRMFMRTLEIRPDHPSAALLIRQIEKRNDPRIAAARSDWARQGFAQVSKAALAANANAEGASGEQLASLPPPDDEEPEETPPATPEPTRVTTTDQPRTISRPRQQERPSAVAAAPTRPRVVTRSVPSNSSNAAAENRRRETRPSRPAPRRETRIARNEPRNRTRESAPRNHQAEPARSRQAEPVGPAAQIDAAISVPPRNTQRQAPPPAEELGEHGMLTSFVLSVEDKRLARRREAIDGVTVELKDTDDDPCADFDLLFGTQRFRKARELSPGQAVAFRGLSGRRFRVLVLAIHDEMETVEFGIEAD